MKNLLLNVFINISTGLNGNNRMVNSIGQCKDTDKK